MPDTPEHYTGRRHTRTSAAELRAAVRRELLGEETADA